MSESAMNTITLPVEAAPIRRFRWLLAPLTAFLVTRIAIIVIVLLADVMMPGFNGIHVYDTGNVASGFVGAWDRWDAVYYVDIAEHGYNYIPGYARNNVAFYPLYPLSMSALDSVTNNPLLSGLIISNLCFLAALILLYQVVLLHTRDEAIASTTIFYLAAFPAAFFFSAVYTESPFLLLSVATIYFALRHQWFAAGVMGGLASATRTSGFLLVLVVGAIWLEAHGWSLSRIRQRSAWESLWRGLRSDWLSLLPILLIPLGLLIYMAYLAHAFGDPLAGIKSQYGWRQPSNLQSFLNDVQLFLHGQLWPSYIMDMVVFFIVMALIIPIGRKFGAGLALYTALSLLIPATTGVMSITRFVTVLFPVFMLLAVWIQHHSRFDRVLRVVFLIFLTLFALAFVKNVFLG